MPPAEARQRWRLTFSRRPVAPDAVGRAALDAWQQALVESGLPVAGLEAGGTGRARLSFGAPLPATATGEAELADLWLLQRRAAWEVRVALAGRLPAGHGWVGAADVWLGAPALAGRIVAADWRVELIGGEEAGPAGPQRLADGVRALLAANTWPRTRLKGGAEKRYDLRPLVADVSLVAGDPGRSDDVEGMFARIRTRIDPEMGSGRPEEVVAALGEAARMTLRVGAVSRERLVLADDADAPPRP